jgi:hypothetical protein
MIGPRTVVSLIPVAGLLACGSFAAGQTHRIENEYKLNVPRGLEENIHRFLRAAYAVPRSFAEDPSATYHASFAEERFHDQYFDTPQLELLGMNGGVRHRVRRVIEGSDFEKDGRELVQIKLDRPGDLEVNRSEIKFSVRPERRPGNYLDAHPVLGLLQRSRRGEFVAELAVIGVNAGTLSPTLLLEQRRRRVYLHREGAAFATITLDEVSTSRWWRTVRFTEIEIELNENAYTEAEQVARAGMQEVSDAMKRELLAAFPQLRQDQTPKYNKAYAALAQEFLLYRFADRYGIPMEAGIPAAVLMMLAIMLAGSRLQRVRPTPRG